MKKFIKKIWHWYLNIKLKIWEWYCHIIRNDDEDIGRELNKIERFIYVIMFPIDYIKFNREDSSWNGYNYLRNVWHINGLKFSGELF